MTELERWLQSQAAREQRIVLLEEGLLGGRLWSYSLYRLRWFFLRYVVEQGTHAVMVLYLFRGLGWDNFLLVVGVYASTSFASSFWWGALEALRGEVRDLHRSGKPHLIPRTIGRWLVLASALGAAVLVAAAAWTIWRAADGGLDAADAYVAALGLRLGLDLPTRAYHSGIYALRRVYKPLWASLAPELTGLVTLLVLWQLTGIWAVVVAAVLTGAMTTAFTLHYTHRVYHFLGFDPFAEIDARHLPASLPRVGREALAGGGSHAAMALDSLVVLALLYGSKTDSQALIVLFISTPTIRAGVDWAQLLYFDLKRLELQVFTNLRRRFERHTAQLAWLLGLLFWALAAGITTAFYGHGVGILYLALLGFFLARSVLANAQIEAFAERSYAAVLGTGLLCLVGLGAVGPVAEGEAARLGAVALVAAVSAAALALLTRRAQARGEPGNALLTGEWLRRLGHVREAVRVGSAQVVSATGPERLDARTREERNRWRLEQLAERTARRLGHAGGAAWIGPDRVVWFEGAGRSPRITADWLQRASGGLIAQVVARECPTGEEALLAAGHEGLLGDASDHLLTAVLPVDLEAARRRFAELVPGGVVYSTDEPVPALLASLPGSELRAIFADAATFARDLGVRKRRSRFDVTALCAGGELRLILVADVHAGRKARGRWRSLVTTLNVRAAIGGVRRPRAAAVGRLGFLRA